MRKSSGEPKSIEAEIESSNSEEREEAEAPETAQTDEPSQDVAPSPEKTESDDWWSASEQPVDWGTSAGSDSPEEAVPSNESRKADIYFCGHTTFFPLNRALQAISREKLTGLLRSFWEQEPIDLLARDGEIVFVTTKDPEFYCPETPAMLANIDEGSVANVRDQQRETGIPFFLALTRHDLLARDSALELMQQCGQKLFSQLWTAPRVWISFEKNADLLTDAADLPGEPNVRDWALETLRLVEYPDETAHFEPASIPAYTKDGFERVQKLKLTPDEAQFASQFNGNRSVQQIAKNLRLDLKSAKQMLFRFVALEIVECWPASSAAKPEQQGIFQRFGRLTRRDR
ncbi:MAG TPA: DUF4388 domain-containing protein [Candidatus Udaeobacter sp.]|jgi:hypothetical protein|nr:DUF4388 domain-containing protein [Candidatus Udaeobacter sp.]